MFLSWPLSVTGPREFEEDVRVCVCKVNGSGWRGVEEQAVKQD